jgi:ABC-type multidrug transport system ATPase subunit
VEKRFGAMRALRGVDLTVERGTIHAVLGPNGAGKTTLLRILAGLSHATAGSVEIDIDGENHEPSKARGAIGYVGHATLIHPELTARENLLFAAKLYRVDDAEARAQQLLEDEALGEVADVRAGSFSRGMSQRLSIARARIHDPILVLLDEPFTGLDRAAASRLAEHLERLRDEGRALVLITHDVEIAARLATTVSLLDRGEISEVVSGSAITVDRLDAGMLGDRPQPGAVA